MAVVLDPGGVDRELSMEERIVFLELGRAIDIAASVYIVLTHQGSILDVRGEPSIGKSASAVHRFTQRWKRRTMRLLRLRGSLWTPAHLENVLYSIGEYKAEDYEMVLDD